MKIYLKKWESKANSASVSNSDIEKLLNEIEKCKR